ncbi:MULTISPECIES: ABC transporter permease [Mameliella]|uniref:ABC transporter permease n=1 Tax=Mameliella TaxID=1434019 RepID=UPI0008807B86|nr:MULTISPECIES: ABC transporter permease [Mameliella]MCR9275219.1 ABC transporter permease [Paracoccaceae bacterium]MBY6118895.1 ABC transporter permease [Mameliella alba]MDD9732008.1 ABC transporter permease [Mameliella sp. AT18]OWV43819.1 polyamine ABC transporter permease [Mameliella alba]OWV49111.1 polyamine ABC transporter permease [Mameliella alba]
MSTLKGSGPQTSDAPTPEDAFHEAAALDARESEPRHGSGNGGPVLAADGTPLKRSLARALRAQKMRALALIAPLLIFVLLTFIAPIADMLFRSVENQIVRDTLPRTVEALADWDDTSGELPGDAVFDAAYTDIFLAAEYKLHTRLGSRLNYELTGVSSLFRKSGRGLDDIGEVYLDQFEDLDEAWDEALPWAELMGTADSVAAYKAWVKAEDKAKENNEDFNDPIPAFEMRDDIADVLPRTAEAYSRFATFVRDEDEDSPFEEEPWTLVVTRLYEDLRDGDVSSYNGPRAEMLKAADALVDSPDFQTADLQAAFGEIDEDWLDTRVWQTIKTYSPAYTNGYFLNAVDMQKTPDGAAMRDEDERIYGLLFKRTMFMSLVITFSCIALAYPVAYLLSTLPMRTANLLMILVLLPFWTSLLVRTSAWKVMLQQQGVINDVLVWLGLVADDGRLVMINNQLGTIIAMTHILLPFMILPMYSVMSTIPPTYVRAAKSLGATNWTSFWRVYFPQSVPGIGAGSILVFILSIGYYITPEIVGGTTGTFISNRIAYHISSSLNWGLAAALGTILLAVVLILYWAYDRIVGIDNVKLGG